MKLNKKQKRTATIASMAALLAVVLGMGGQTFAKYIETHDVGSNTATVAKWGLTAAMSNNMFATTYEKGQTNTTSKDGDSVVTLSSSELVAPGTEGSVTITLGGVAEVDAYVTFESTIVVPKLNEYYPIAWTVDGKAVTDNSAEGVKNAVDAVTRFYDAGTKTYAEEITISWSWAFDQGKNDEDTLLGQIANGKYTVSESNGEKVASVGVPAVSYTYETAISFGLKVTFTQAD